MLTTILSLCLLAPQGRAEAPVVVNEFSYQDDTGADDLEYVELFNRSNAPVDISGWALATATPAGAGPRYTLPLGTAPLPPGAFFVLGSLRVPRVSLVVGATDLFGNDTTALTLRDAADQIVDTVMVETHRGVFDPLLAEGGGIVGEAILVEAHPAAWSRWHDGRDTHQNGCDFRLLPWTPGTSNDLPPFAPSSEDFDRYTVGASIAGWDGTVAPPRAIDPTVVSASNPNVITASPQGGNAGAFWSAADASHAMRLTQPTDAAVLEAWVYLDATRASGTELQMWSLGFGTSDSAFAFPDPTGALGFTTNGNTGVAWTLVHTAAGVALHLVDHGVGGRGWLIASWTILPGVSDGWQRLRLRFDATTLEGEFRGAIAGARRAGCRPLAAFTGYRSTYTNPAARRPLTVDALTIQAPSPGDATLEYYGEAVPNSVARPYVTTTGYPRINWRGFDLRAQDLRPASPCLFLLGASALAFPLLPFGSQPDAMVLVNPILSLPTVADGQGLWSLPLVAPVGSAGTRLFAQLLELDPALAFALPVAHTQGVALGIGN